VNTDMVPTKYGPKETLFWTIITALIFSSELAFRDGKRAKR
jgi:hypothetical protein